MTDPTPYDIAALAETRRRDPDLALSIAEQSGKAHDQITRQPLALIGAETKSKEPKIGKRTRAVR